jgi:ABC-type lipoprotein export system ATPase subunit
VRNVVALCDDRGVLLSTHDTSLLDGFDRVLELRGGTVCEAPAPVGVDGMTG